MTKITREQLVQIITEEKSRNPDFLVDLAEILEFKDFDKDLSSLDLSNIDKLLKMINFSGIELKRVNFQNSDLSNSVFAQCDLEECDFSMTSFWYTDFSQTVISNCNFFRSDIAEADFSKSKINYCNFTSSTIIGSKTEELEINDSIFLDGNKIIGLAEIKSKNFSDIKGVKKIISNPDYRFSKKLLKEIQEQLSSEEYKEKYSDIILTIEDILKTDKAKDDSDQESKAISAAIKEVPNKIFQLKEEKSQQSKKNNCCTIF